MGVWSELKRMVLLLAVVEWVRCQGNTTPINYTIYNMTNVSDVCTNDNTTTCGMCYNVTYNSTIDPTNTTVTMQAQCTTCNNSYILTPRIVTGTLNLATNASSSMDMSTMCTVPPVQPPPSSNLAAIIILSVVGVLSIGASVGMVVYFLKRKKQSGLDLGDQSVNQGLDKSTDQVKQVETAKEPPSKPKAEEGAAKKKESAPENNKPEQDEKAETEKLAKKKTVKKASATKS